MQQKHSRTGFMALVFILSLVFSAQAETDYCAKPGAKKVALAYLNAMLSGTQKSVSGETDRRIKITTTIREALKLYPGHVDNIATTGDSLHYIKLGNKVGSMTGLSKKSSRTHLAFLWPFSTKWGTPGASDRLSAVVIKNGEHTLGARVHFCHYRFPNKFLTSNPKAKLSELRIDRNSTTVRFKGTAAPYSKKAQRFKQGVNHKDDYLNKLHIVFFRAESKRRSGSFWLLLRNKVGKGQPSMRKATLALAKKGCLERKWEEYCHLRRNGEKVK